MVVDWRTISFGWTYTKTRYARYITMGRLVIAIRRSQHGSV